MERVFTTRLSAAALFTLVGLTAGSSAEAYTFNFQTYNNPGDLNFNQLLGINNSGTIAGYFGDGTVAPNNGYTFVPPSSYTAENFPGSAQTQAIGINSTGTTVGFYADNAGDNFGFYNIGGSFTSVNNPATPATTPSVNQLLGVNDSNVAAGFYTDASGNNNGYTYNIASNSFTPVTLPANFNAMSTTATDINNAGIVSGFFTDTSDNTYGFLDVGGMFTKLNDPNGTNTMAFGLNNIGDVVGSYTDMSGVTQGFLYNWNSMSWQTISDPNASANAAFGVNGTTLNGINDKLQLVGFYSDGTNVNGFVASIPEPSTWAMMLGGFAGLGLFGYRRSQRKTAIAL